MRNAGIVVAAFIFLLGLAAGAWADSQDVNVAVKAKPKTIIELDTTFVAFGEIDPDMPVEINASSSAYAVRVRVKSNERWDYSYSATDFTSSGGTTFTVSSLAWKPNSGSVYQSFEKGQFGLGTNLARGVTDFEYDYRLTVPWEADGDTTYTAIITYTVIPK